QARWISGRTDEQEVVVHHDAAAHEIAAINQGLLRLGRVRQHHVRVSAPTHRERLPAAGGDHLDDVTGLPLEHGQQRVEQPGVAGGGSGGEDDVMRLGGKGRQRAARGGNESRRQSKRRCTLPPSAAFCRLLPPFHHHLACIWTMTRLLSTAGPCSSNTVYSSCSFRSSPEKKYCAAPV